MQKLSSRPRNGCTTICTSIVGMLHQINNNLPTRRNSTESLDIANQFQMKTIARKKQSVKRLIFGQGPLKKATELQNVFLKN